MFHGKQLPWTVKALVADLDGEIIGIGGVYYDGDRAVAFSGMKSAMRRFPMTMARGALAIMRLIGNQPCLAVPNPDEPGAERLLGRLGFEPFVEQVWRWAGQRQ